MKLHYDKHIDALSIRFSNLPYKESEEVQNGIIFDYDKKGRVIAIEILDASKVLPKNFEKSSEKEVVMSIVGSKTASKNF